MKSLKKRNIKVLIIPLGVALFNLFIIFYPNEIIAAAKDGLSLWFNSVLPSLLPFIIGTNLLAGLGAINFIGTLLEPVMQPLFGVPGAGGFAMITGMTSGYPMGAKVTASLRQSELINKTEAQRLLSFANNSGPLFILGAVGIGMFQSEKAGYFLMAVHYISAIINGLLFKYYGYKRSAARPQANNRRIMNKAVKSMYDARQQDGRSFGQLLGNSVAQAMESVLQIGGFIILFCVLIKILEITGIPELFTTLLAPMLEVFDIPANLVTSFLYGIIEVTNGARAVANQGIAGQQLIAAAVLISFGGFSIHAQSINFLSKTDISSGMYILSKATHGLITFIVATLTAPLFDFSIENPMESVETFYIGPVGALYYSTVFYVLTILALFIIAMFIYTALKINRKRHYR